jgi:hypothetical protein
MTALAQAIERHRAAQAAIDAADGPEGYPDHLRDEEFDAIDELAETPCASDAENSDIWGAGLQSGIRSNCCRCRSSLQTSPAPMKSACVRPARWARSAMSRTKKARRGMTQLEQPPFAAKAMAAVIRVGDGRGFVIARAGIPNRSARQAPHQQYMQCNMEYRT